MAQRNLSPNSQNDQQPPRIVRNRASFRSRGEPGEATRVEVIRLEHQQLVAKSSFTCEVCGQHFNRKPNLVLHLHSHSIKVSMRDKGGRGEVVYTCPIPDCIHHDANNALGDITGIKKHYARKHCEKVLPCRKNCGKKYALELDLRAHEKRCNTPIRENENEPRYNEDYHGSTSAGQIDLYNLTFVQLLSCTNLTAQELEVLNDIESAKLQDTNPTIESINDESFANWIDLI